MFLSTLQLNLTAGGGNNVDISFYNSLTFGNVGRAFPRSSQPKFQLNDPLTFVIDLVYGNSPINVSASIMSLVLLKPGTTTSISRTMAMATTGIDGKVTYNSPENELNVVGIWNMQVIIDGTFHSEVDTFEIVNNL